MTIGAADRSGILCRLLALLLLPAHATATAPTLTAEFTPAWEGRFVPGRSTEIAVSLVSARGGPFELTISNQPGGSQYHGVLEADVPSRIRLPVQPTRGRPLTIGLIGPANARLQRELVFSPVSRPMDILLPAPAATARMDNQRAVQGLPGTAEGYAPVGTLTIATSLLPALRPEQILALDRYLGSCGVLYVQGSGPELLNRLRATAGCGGRYIRPQNALASNPGRPPPLPGTKALDQLMPEATMEPAQTLALFFLAYTGILLLAARVSRGAVLPLSIPLTASLTLLLFWPLHEEPPRMASWAEMESGDRVARFSTLLTLSESRQAVQQIYLSRILGAPEGSDETVTSLILDAGHPAREQLQIPSIPFARHTYRFQSAISLIPGISIESRWQSPPEVINRGDDGTPSGLLAWKGEIHRLPMLAPGEHWTPSDGTRLTRLDGPGRLLRTVTGTDDSAMLLPFSLRAIGLVPDSVREAGWLLMRPRRPAA